MYANSVSLNLSFPQKGKNNDSKSEKSIIFINERKINNMISNQIQNTNKENYPKEFFQNEQYILTNLYHSIKKNMENKKIKNKTISPDLNKKVLSFPELEKIVHKSFIKFYKDDSYYNVIKIDEIINNEKSHLVAEFKDFLVMGDTGEFILKYYIRSETNKIYKQILDYYNENLFIFPNYVSLPESKYIYNSIQKKQKIIDIQEELNDNKEKEKEKNNKNNNESNPVFSVKEIDSILNETNTSGIKKYFGITESNTENGIEQNEKQILELIDKINILEKKNMKKEKSFNTNNNSQNKTMNLEKSSNGTSENYSKDKIFLKIENREKAKMIKGRNEKINIYGQDKSKSISDLKISENKNSKQTSNLSQPNLYCKNSKAMNINFMNSLNEKNNSKEMIIKLKEKVLEKDNKANDVIPLTKRKIMENLNHKDNKKLLNKILNSTKNISLFYENNENNMNNGMNLSSNKIKINKSILKEIGNYKSKGKQDNISQSKEKSYKNELMNLLFCSKIGLNNSKKINYKDSKSNLSGIDNILTSTISEEKSANITNKYFFKNGQNLKNAKIDKKSILSNKNQLSNSCQNIIINSYATKNMNVNKININYFTNRDISYKLIQNISNNKNKSNILFKSIRNPLSSNESQKSKINRKHSMGLMDSYSTKEITKKNKGKSPNYFRLKLLQKSGIHNKKRYNYHKNIKSKCIINPNFPQNNKKNSPLTERRTQQQININLEKIETLSRNIRKIKETLKRSVDNSNNNNYNLSSILLNKKSKSTMAKSKDKIIKKNNNVIKVYLMNKTRNRIKKNYINSVNFPSFKTKGQSYNSLYMHDKEKNSHSKKKNNFQTINYSNSVNKVNQKNNIDFFRDRTLMNHNKNKNK